MKLFEQLIQKSISLSDEAFLEKRYKRAVWHFYKAFNISISLVGYDENISKRIKLYKRFLLSNQSINSKLFKKINALTKIDMNYVIKAINLINKTNEELGYEFGEYYKEGTIAMLTYEFPEE